MAFATHEVYIQSDLNGDGDMGDSILAYHDVTDNTTTYTTAQPITYYTSPSISGDLIAFTTSEVYMQRDLNGDGDMGDSILAYHDVTDNTTTYTGEQPTYETSPSISGDLIAFAIHETYMQSDLNGDGDMTDVILAYHDITDNTTTYTSEQIVYYTSPSISGDLIAFATHEAYMQSDLNGDGDMGDSILAY